MASSLAGQVPIDGLYARNRSFLDQVLAYYDVKTIDELHAKKDDKNFWKEKLWSTWNYSLREWGMCAQVFDMTKGEDGVYKCVDTWTGKRSFFKDEDGLLHHKTAYQKSTGLEEKEFTFPKEDNLLDDGMGVASMGAMFSEIRMIGFPHVGKLI